MASRANEVADLYHQSVHAIDTSIYTPEEQEAWASTPPDYHQWSVRLAKKQPWLAMLGGRVAGFIELDADGHIDCLYTHPSFQNQGVASGLYEHLLWSAKARGFKRLYVEASIVAKPFFEHRGFKQVAKNSIQRKGVTLVNFTLEKRLDLSN
jgi:putative acetyltransferase